MGKNQSASNLTNIIKQDGSGNIVFTSGSTTLATISTSGQLSGSTPALSASYAATSSYATNFNVSGTITATTLVVQTVTSSVVYSSGSNIFGNNIANTQTFTGSVSMTGSLAVVTNGTEFQVTSTGVNLGNALTDSHVISGSVRINPNGLFISGSGLVGIGTTTPQSILHSIRSNNVTASSGTTPSGYALSFGSVDGNNGGIWFSGDFGGDQGICGINGSRTSGYQTELAFYTNNTNSARAFSERMRISAAGNVGIGTSNPIGPLMIAVPAVGSAIGATNSQQAYDYSRFRIKHYTDSNLGISIGYAGANLTYIQTGYNEGSTAPLLMNPFGGEVRVGTGGLKFSNGSTALNYYEEGTFTPTGINTNMSAVTPVFGRYVRIGSQIVINVRWNVEPGGTGVRYIVFNLPFAFNIASGVSYTGAVSNYNSGTSSGSSNVGTSVRNSSGSDTQQYVEAVFTTNTSTTVLFSMTYFTF